MRTFTDNAGRAWSIVVNVTTIARVRSLCNVNLLDVVDGKLGTDLAGDPVLLANVLYAVCRPEAVAAQIGDTQFGEGLSGDAIDSAATALLEAIVDFFPSRRRLLLQKVMVKATAQQEKMIAAAESAIDSGKLDELLAKSVGDSAGNSPESSASIPAPSPSATSP